MLKKICGLFLGLVVLAGSACVTPTHASSASSVVITYIQTTGVTGAKEELVVIHNNSAVDIDISNWCLLNKANVAFVCFTTQASSEDDMYYVLPPYQSATIASYEYSAAHGGPDYFSLVYPVTNQSSGSIVSSADSISLINADQEVIDSKSWVSPVPTGKALLRMKLFSAPDIYATGNNTADWAVSSLADAPASGSVLRIVPKEGEESEGDVDNEEPGEETEEDEPSEHPPVDEPEKTLPQLSITEVFPNAVGADAGHEFIELHNSHDSASYSLAGLKLRIGSETAKWYTLPEGSTIPAGGYFAFTDSDLGFTLINTQGAVQLYDGNIPLSEPISYTSPKEGESWALIDRAWQYTNKPTPGFANSLSVLTPDEDNKAIAQKPCASNQFRNPETGRCKLIATASLSPAACKAGQARNPETNRCRATAVTDSPAPCKEGQERNAETNRCRNIVKMSTAGYGVKGVQNKAGAQLSWYYWVAIIGIVVVILAYAVWEWRHELAGVWKKMTFPFAKR